MKKNKGGIDLHKLLFDNIREWTLIGLILLITVLVQMRTGGRFLSAQNLYDLFREASLLLMVSAAMMPVILTGGIDLSVGAVMGLSGMIGALILREHRGIPLVLLFLIVLLTGCLCGAFNGLVVSRLHIFPIIATLGAQDIFRGLTYVFSKGAWVGQGDMTPAFLAISTNTFLGINNLVWIALLIILAEFLFMKYTRPGRQIYQVGNSEQSSRVTGIKTARVKLMAYTICGSVCGLAGLLWICKFGNAQGDSASGYEMSVIAACVLGGASISGGVGKVFGVALGALLIGILNNILPLIQVSSFWQQAIRGFIILFSVVINALTQRSMDKKALRRWN